MELEQKKALIKKLFAVLDKAKWDDVDADFMFEAYITFSALRRLEEHYEAQKEIKEVKKTKKKVTKKKVEKKDGNK